MSYSLSPKTLSAVSKQKVFFLLLTKDEQGTIEAVINNLKQVCENLKIKSFQIVLADDSSDSTPDIAKKNGAIVVSGGKKGLGRAFIVGAKACVEMGADLIVSLDGDGQVDLDEVALFLDILFVDEADMVIGSRFLEGKHIEYNYPKLNRFGVLLLSTYLTVMTGQRITDSHGGIRIMRSRVAKDMEIIGTHTYVQEAIIDAHQHNYKIIEIPSRWKVRNHGGSRVLKSKLKYIRTTSPILIKRAISLWKKKLEKIV